MPIQKPILIAGILSLVAQQRLRVASGRVIVEARSRQSGLMRVRAAICRVPRSTPLMARRERIRLPAADVLAAVEALAIVGVLPVAGGLSRSAALAIQAVCAGAAQGAVPVMAVERAAIRLTRSACAGAIGTLVETILAAALCAAKALTGSSAVGTRRERVVPV
ncbi:MAG: hypothetical protein EXS05_16905 [Planctomycetaceae bacterium]|nr:hypothetical protein [Planctomycetaceae bacterium]